MEIINSIWVWILSILGGLSLSTIFVFVIKLTISSAVKKMFNKINVDKIAEKATDKGIERVKKISFTQNIQPLVESELKKINEYSVAVLKQELLEVKAKYDKVINILDKLASYFDNSIGVPEEKKAELRKAIVEAVEEPQTADCVVVEEDTKKDTNVVVEPKIQAKTSTKVER